MQCQLLVLRCIKNNLAATLKTYPVFIERVFLGLLDQLVFLLRLGLLLNTLANFGMWVLNRF